VAEFDRRGPDLPGTPKRADPFWQEVSRRWDTRWTFTWHGKRRAHVQRTIARPRCA
jgi:hypothetical protein